MQYEHPTTDRTTTDRTAQEMATNLMDAICTTPDHEFDAVSIADAGLSDAGFVILDRSGNHFVVAVREIR